jgi:outer membrane protein assembly factor BamB
MWSSFRNGIQNQGITNIKFNNNSKLQIPPTYIGGIIWGTCVIDNKDNVYVGSSSGKFFKIGPDGKIIWSYSLFSKTDSLIDSAAALHPNGFVVIPGGDGYLHAIDITNGSRLWTRKAPHNVDDKIDRSGVVVNSFEGNVQINPETGLIYAGNDNGNFYCIDVNGNEKWSLKTNMMIWSCASFCFNNKYITFGCLDHYLYLVDAITGTLIDKYNTGAEIKSSPLVTSNGSLKEYIFISNSNGKLMCFTINANKLEKEWEHDIGKEVYSSAAYKDGLLVTCTFDGVVICIDIKVKRILWQHKLYDPICCSPIITLDNLVVFGNSKGKMYIIELKTGVIQLCSQISKKNLNASPAMDSRGVVHIGSYDGYIYHNTYFSCLKKSIDVVPQFLKEKRTHLDLEYDGIFIKQYRIRVFSDDKYLVNTAIDKNSLNYKGVFKEIKISSDGKYINLIQTLSKPINVMISCDFYNQTDSWLRDRIQQTIDDNTLLQHVSHNIKDQYKIADIFKKGQILMWDLHNLSLQQPKILDTYIPAALDAVTYKAFVTILEDNALMCIMIPSIFDHETNTYVVLQEPEKVLILEGRYENNTIFLSSNDPFSFSSMGGTMKFSKFEVYLYINPSDYSATCEFVVSSSCLNIKGNNNAYKFSSEIINQLCDPFLNISGIGTADGTLIPITFDEKVSSIQLKKSFFGMRTATYTNLYPKRLSKPTKNENLITIVYNTYKNETFQKITFIDSLKSDISTNLPNDIKNVFALVNETYCGHLAFKGA